ncbi:RNA polymerase sigma factor [Kitasatospora sp. NPDC092948]|uniref:RNA polymerase sigma factor n=1 Tax=Kitasatospora sp. NPDC092948 TaxID=3364088 RepID=UPI003815CE9D
MTTAPESPSRSAPADPAEAAAQDRSKKPFGAFYTDTFGQVTRRIQRKGNVSHAEAEELAQETYIRILRTYGDREQDRHKIVSAVADRVVAERICQQQRSLPIAGGVEVPEQPDPAGEDQLRRVEDRDQMEWALDQLPEKTRHYVREHKANGRPAAEVAAEDGTSPSTVKTSAARGIAKLRTFKLLWRIAKALLVGGSVTLISVTHHVMVWMAEIKRWPARRRTTPATAKRPGSPPIRWRPRPFRRPRSSLRRLLGLPPHQGEFRGPRDPGPAQQAQLLETEPRPACVSRRGLTQYRNRPGLRR